MTACEGKVMHDNQVPRDVTRRLGFMVVKLNGRRFVSRVHCVTALHQIDPVVALGKTGHSYSRSLGAHCNEVWYSQPLRRVLRCLL